MQLLAFGSILVPEVNGKNLEECYKLECVDDKFSKPFKFYLSEDAAQKYINSMIKESMYCTDIIKSILKNYLG